MAISLGIPSLDGPVKPGIQVGPKIGIKPGFSWTGGAEVLGNLVLGIKTRIPKRW